MKVPVLGFGIGGLDVVDGSVMVAAGFATGGLHLILR